MVFRKKNVIIVVLIVSLLGGPLAHRVYATDWFAAMKFGLDTAAKAVAQGAFRALTNQVIQKVQTGGLGGALFVQDWREFQLRAQYRGEDVWRGILYFAANGGDGIPPLLCDHIKNSTAFRSLQPTALGTDNAGLLALQRRNNSLQDVFTTLNCDPLVNQRIGIYRQDFVQGGGWDTFARLLSAQNRPEGAINILISELEKQRQIEELAAINEAKAGSGFVGIRECLANRQGTGACAILDRIKTPGSTIGEQVASIFDANVKFYTTADAASLAIAALTQFAFGKLFDSGGLAGADTTSSGTVINNENSYRNEFCTAKDNISSEAIDHIAENFPQALASFPAFTGGRSYCEGKRDKNNVFPFERCINACYKATGLLPDDIDVPQFTDTFTPGNGNGNGGGVCRDPGGTTADYANNLQSAIDAVIANNPNGIADAPNTVNNSFEFLNYVVAELRSAGFEATTNVLNGNDNPNSGDLIALWQNGDSTMERYDAVINVGKGDRPMRQAVTSGQYTGDIPLSCIQ